MRRLLHRLYNVLRPRRGELELAREIASHLAQLEDEFQRRGLSPDEARLAARRAFGGVEQTKEHHRDARSFAWLEDARRDVTYAVRTLGRNPGFAALVVATLTLGIGATTAIFSIASGVLLRPLPFADPGSLVQFEPMGLLDFEDCRRQSVSFESLVAYSAVNKTLQATEPERVAAVAAERGLFDMLGVPPLAGRTFAANDSTKVAVVSEGFWRRRFGGKPALNDWTVTLDGEAYAVVGIMPEWFQFPYRPTITDVWIPWDPPRTANRFQRIDVAIGRVKPDVTFEAARAELRTIGRQFERFYPAPGTMVPITIVPLTEAIVGRSRPALLTLLGAVAMVLLVACANVTNLLLARSEVRTHEVSVRTALGAGRGRLLRQLLTEAVLLALAGGVAAVFIAITGTPLLVALAGAAIPRAFEISPDWRVFLFLLAVSVATGIAFGLAPALHATRLGARGVLGGRASHGRGTTFINRGLVIAEIALAFILLIGSGLLLRALIFLDGAPTGIVADRVLTLRMDTLGHVPPQASPADADSRLTAQGRYFRAIEERVNQIPGVRSAGFVTKLHVQSPGNTGEFTVNGQPLPATGHGVPVRLREASPGYFRTLGIPIRAGRLFTEHEQGILVNETLVREHLRGVNPIGHVLSRGTIVGVVADVRQRLRLPAEPEIYMTLAGTGYSAATLVVSAAIPTDALVGPLRAAIRDVNPNQAVYDIQAMDRVIASAHPDLDLYLWLIGLFGGLALVLSMAGIYGVISYTVASRRREFGIRLALGADPGRLLRLLLSQGGMLIAAGLSIGIAGALILTRFLKAQLYGVTPTDPATFVAVTLVLAGVAFVACLNPARRAMTLDPSTVLRSE